MRLIRKNCSNNKNSNSNNNNNNNNNSGDWNHFKSTQTIPEQHTRKARK